MTVKPAARWWWLDGRAVRALDLGLARNTVPDLVVVPGLGALGYLLPAVRACSAWTRSHLLDVPGFGHRRTAGCSAALGDVSRVVQTWLETVPDRPVLLVGHSTGAQAALHAATAAPGRVAALCLAGPTFPPEARRWGRLAARTVRTLPFESPRVVQATASEYLRSRGRVVTLLRSALRDHPEQTVQHVAAPVVVVRGAHDAVCDAGWAADLTRRADGRLRTLPGGHNFVFQHPDRFSDVLRAVATSV